MSADLRINRLIRDLAAHPSHDELFNPYAKGIRANAARRRNLTRYFQFMVESRPDTLLVGEAPGYKGCRFTGLPFSSEFLVLNGQYPGRDYEQASDGTGSVKENTAGMIWDYLHIRDWSPACWNAFPYHPFPAGQPTKNRKPRSPEVQVGLQFLDRVIELLEPKQVVAVGKVADRLLTNMNVAHAAVRHPSYGGKGDFVKGMDALKR